MRAKPDLAGQTVVVIGGSSGIGLELRASIAAFAATDVDAHPWRREQGKSDV
jgi:NAD(P)-dependent dehydrogenase (short-subunit alcohol dehydrogenase family)